MMDEKQHEPLSPATRRALVFVAVMALLTLVGVALLLARPSAGDALDVALRQAGERDAEDEDDNGEDA